MPFHQTELRHLEGPTDYRYVDLEKKPIEMYVFVDPFCPKCWSLEPYIKKLSLEYGRFFTIRPIISNHLSVIQSAQHNTEKLTNDHAAPLFPCISLAIKAAELQGTNAGRRFLRKIQENHFLKSKNIQDIRVLLRSAKDAKLDVSEFKKDLYSNTAKKAFQYDIRITAEMNVNKTPTIVAFNHITEDHGIKLPGVHSYDIYVHIIDKMLHKAAQPAHKPSIEDYVACSKIVSNKEIAIVYDMTYEAAERTLNKLQLKQQVKKEILETDILWIAVD